MRRALLGVALTFAFAGCSGTAVAPDTAGGSAGTNAGDGSIGGSSGVSGSNGGSSSNGGSTASNASTGTNASTASNASTGSTGTPGSTSTGSTGTTATTVGTNSSTGTSATTVGTNSSTGTSATTVGTNSSTGTSATTVGTNGSTGTSATTVGNTTGSSAGTTNGSTGSSGSTGATPQGFVRAADFVPFGLNADFCYKPAASAATAYVGPVMANTGVSAGIGFGQVTRYFGFDDPAPSGGTTYTIAVVLAGSTTCVNPQAQANLTVTANTYSTIYGVGVPFGAPTLSQHSLSDDSAALAGNSTAFRFVNAGLGTAANAVDLGSVTSNTFGSIFNNVLFTGVSSTSNFNGSFGTVDANGYLGFDARTLQLRVRTHGTTGNGALDSQSVTFAATTRHSLFVIGDGSNNFPYRLLDCTDELTLATSANAFTTCQ